MVSGSMPVLKWQLCLLPPLPQITRILDQMKLLRLPAEETSYRKSLRQPICLILITMNQTANLMWFHSIAATQPEMRHSKQQTRFPIMCRVHETTVQSRGRKLLRRSRMLSTFSYLFHFHLNPSFLSAF